MCTYADTIDGETLTAVVDARRHFAVMAWLHGSRGQAGRLDVGPGGLDAVLVVSAYAGGMATYKLVGGPRDRDRVDELPDGYVALGTGSVSSDDPNAEGLEIAEYEG